MKYLNKNIYRLSLASTILLAGCSDFDKINVDPNAANVGQVRVEYSINKSITDAQQNPEVAERAFVLSWTSVARMHDPNMGGGLPTGSYSDDWISNYYGHFSGWMNAISQAINIADIKLAGELNSHDAKLIPNFKQVARIWRAYLMSEFTDNFGAMPIKAFNGVNPEFDSAKDVYYFMLAELKDAAAALDIEAQATDAEKATDRAFKYDFAKWQKYANSLRMRLAMRLSEVDAEKAREEFEDAVKGPFIQDLSDNLAIQERDGWDPLAGVFSREWNYMGISATVNNLIVGLGGVPSAEVLASRPNADELLTHIKPADYMGVRYDDHMALNTNDPAKGFWFDGLRHTVDPRAYTLYQIPGDFEDADYCKYPTYNNNSTQLVRALLKPTTNENKTDTLELLNSKFTWNASAVGEWGDKGALNQMYYWPWARPSLKLNYRNSTNKRVFFGAWESYFLIAEAAVRGWTVPMNGKAAYEAGINSSFAHFGVSQFAGQYIQSQSYNNVGTSVKWDHTADATSVEMKMIDGYTKKTGTYTYNYPNPANTLYGKSLNDHLSKIITQKYIANMPYLPLEAWSDYRRLGLPFMETPAVEQPISTMPTLTPSSYNKQTTLFFAQRFKFPSSLENSSPAGYKGAVELLGGPDNVFTPIWWAKKK